MKSKRPKTAAEVRRANRGNVPGVLGMAELAMLIGDRCRTCGVLVRADLNCIRSDCGLGGTTKLP